MLPLVFIGELFITIVSLTVDGKNKNFLIEEVVLSIYNYFIFDIILIVIICITFGVFVKLSKISKRF